jgi:hypothetical protein
MRALTRWLIAVSLTLTVYPFATGCGDRSSDKSVDGDLIDIGHGKAMHRADIQRFADENHKTFEEARQDLSDGEGLRQAADQIQKNPEAYGVRH